MPLVHSLFLLLYFFPGRLNNRKRHLNPVFLGLYSLFQTCEKKLVFLPLVAEYNLSVIPSFDRLY
jgi:hypothetical protein